MNNYFFQGFLLGLAYVAPIGMQNLYVINTAIRWKKIRAYQVAFITIFFDISLALACFYGMGILLAHHPVIRNIILLAGSIAVIIIGIQLLRSSPGLSTEIEVDKPLLEIALACFAVTWMNPQAIIDGSLLLGAFRASLSLTASKLFILGVCLASFSWFFGLTTLVTTFRNKINGKIIKGINAVCGFIILYYGLKLGYEFLRVIK